MHISPLSTTSALILCAALTSAAPSPSPIRKRDMCKLIGVRDIDQVIGGGGPGQTPVVKTFDGVTIEYVGGVRIKGSVPGAFGIGVNPQTLQPADTNLPNPITYTPNYVLGGFRGCSVEYEGKTYEGTASSSTRVTGNKSRCRTDFECEGNIAGD